MGDDQDVLITADAENGARRQMAQNAQMVPGAISQ